MFSQIMGGVMVVSAHDACFFDVSFLQGLLRMFYTPNTEITAPKAIRPFAIEVLSVVALS